VLAQLRGVLAAEQSAEVAQEDQNHWSVGPVAPKAVRRPVGTLEFARFQPRQVHERDTRSRSPPRVQRTSDLGLSSNGLAKCQVVAVLVHRRIRRVSEPFSVEVFANTFQQFMRDVNQLVPRPSPLADRLGAHLGADPGTLATVSEQLSIAEHPNLQLTLNELADASEPPSELIGLPTEVTYMGGFSLASIASGRFMGPTDSSAVSYLNQRVDVDRTMPCVELGIYLLHHEGSPIVAFVMAGGHRGPRQAGLILEVLALDRDTASRFVAAVRDGMDRLNVYRHKVLEFAFSQHGEFGLTFRGLPPVSREDIVLSPGVLEAIEAHTVGIGEQVDALRAARRHLKRGLLLHGPPGTGKTFTVMYLCNRMPERTTVLLTGQGVGALGQAVALARKLEPAMVVLEDVDLVASARDLHPMAPQPMLFQLLNEMDGLHDDSDIVFVLTTNRVELLEPALASRPGRIDQAVEVPLPDGDCRRRLLHHYLELVDHQITATDSFVERTSGVSAAFIKELVRRSVLVAATQGRTTVTDGHLAVALDDLLSHGGPLLRSLLGAATEAAPSAGPPADHHGGDR
jgi:hypothetical protein